MALELRRQGRFWRADFSCMASPCEVLLAVGSRAEAQPLCAIVAHEARRFLLVDGVRYPHILNPRTGWPIMRAPRSVTVLGDTCTEAGLAATLAMLQGVRAEEFLAAEGVQSWVIR